MKRRELITLFGGLAAAWPLAARAQQEEQIPRIGVLLPNEKGDAQTRDRLKAFEQALQKLGWTDGSNLHIERRWAGTDQQQLRDAAAELVGLKPQVILTSTALALSPLQQATRVIPIVFVSLYDPVGTGFVTNLAHPDANITGFALAELSLGGKMLQQLKEVAPKIDHAAIVFKPDQAPQVGLLHAIEAIAPSLGVRLTAVPVLQSGEIGPAIEAAAREPNSGLVVLPNPLTLAHREEITGLVAHYGVPAVYGTREFVMAGGLMSYGANLIDEYRRAAAYVDRILRGATPAELPVQEPTKFELVINLKAAKALGLTISNQMQLLADEVIE
jgi:putative ABC transport system substrate-binding protein